MEQNNLKPADIMSDDVDAKERTKGKIRKIVVDREGCIGARSCVVVAPGVFQLDDGNLAYIVDPNSDEDDIVKMAAESCPVLAIHLYDEDGKKIFPK